MGKRISCQCPVINMSRDRQGKEFFLKFSLQLLFLMVSVFLNFRITGPGIAHRNILVDF